MNIVMRARSANSNFVVKKLLLDNDQIVYCPPMPFSSSLSSIEPRLQTISTSSEPDH